MNVREINELLLAGTTCHYCGKSLDPNCTPDESTYPVEITCTGQQYLAHKECV